jgi:DNA replication and repair protein RecF
MLLNKIILQNFRSYKKQIISVFPTVTVIHGPNATGKTNIIEAIAVLSTGKSFRADLDREMIQWDSEFARVKASVEDTNLELLITAGIVGGQKTPLKKYLVNGVSKRGIDFVGNIKTVLFWPEDLDLVTDSPSLRRHYLDRVLIQIDREYRRNLMSYEKGLRQRNKLLDLIKEGLANHSQLLFWNQLLIKAGNYITDTRAQYIDYVNHNHILNSMKNQINNNIYTIDYDKSIISDLRLLQYKDEEVAAGATLVGPHRDDFIFYKFRNQNNTDIANKLNLSKYGSRGEQRLGVLWLKLSELAYIQEKSGDRPILLLDDIFSELDDKHRSLVLELIQKQQTIITSAEDDVIDILKKSRIGFSEIRLPFGDK